MNVVSEKMYRKQSIGPGNDLHAGSGFTEVLIIDTTNEETIIHFMGKWAKLNAQRWMFDNE
jgi:hypothetical protein